MKKWKITLSDGTEELYTDWDKAFDRWMEVDSALEFVGSPGPENSVIGVSLDVERGEHGTNPRNGTRKPASVKKPKRRGRPPKTGKE